MPDHWESDHGLDPLVHDAAGNPDLDRHDNWSEYIADTDPLDPQSGLRCSILLQPDGRTTTIRFPSSTNRRYALEFRDPGGTADWQFARTNVPGQGGEMVLEDSAPGTQRLYRVPVSLP